MLDYAPSKKKNPREDSTHAIMKVKNREEDLLSFTAQCECNDKCVRKICRPNRRIHHIGSYQCTINIFNNSKIYLTLKHFFNYIRVILQFSGSDEILHMYRHCVDKRQNRRECEMPQNVTENSIPWAILFTSTSFTS